MRKETEETIGFFVTFMSLATFQLEEARATCPPLATPMRLGIVAHKTKRKGN